MKTIIIFLFIIFFSVSVKAGTLSLFEKNLITYCVPKNADGCVNKATYNTSNNTCNCAGNLIYVDRECRSLKCPSGTYIVLDNYSDTCPVGYGKFIN